MTPPPLSYIVYRRTFRYVCTYYIRALSFFFFYKIFSPKKHLYTYIYVYVRKKKKKKKCLFRFGPVAVFRFGVKQSRPFQAASDMWRNARTCARMPEPQPVLGDLAGFCALTGTSYHRNDLTRLNAIFRVKFGNVIFFSYLCSPISKTV